MAISPPFLPLTPAGTRTGVQLMTKPLGYYTNHTPGQPGVINDFEEAYGSQLQDLSKSEKLAFIALIAQDLCCLASTATPYRSEIFNWMPKIRETLSTDDREGLIEALINSVRYQ
jgi:hypothetical protein